MCRHHHGGLRLAFLDCGQSALSVKLRQDHHRHSTHQQSHSIQRTSVIHRTDHKVSAVVSEAVDLHSLKMFRHSCATSEHGWGKFGSFGKTGCTRGIEQVGAWHDLKRRVTRVPCCQPSVPISDLLMTDIPAHDVDEQTLLTGQARRLNATL